MTKWRWGALSIVSLMALSIGSGLSSPAKAEIITYTLAFNPTVGTGGTGTLVLDFASPPTGITILTGTALANDFVSFTETVDGTSFTTPLVDVSLISLFNTTLTDIVASTTNDGAAEA
jgi:hypothetical protein